MTHLFCLNITHASYPDLYGKAAQTRKSRADQYVHREDALRCVASEGLLRYAVARELGAVEFSVETDPLGKPYLPGIQNVHFNISHSGAWVVLAWGDSPVGVDVEKIRSGIKKEALASRFFTSDEQSYVFGRVDGQEQRFLEIWTAKESYLKYLGTGLRRPLNSFSVLSLQENLYRTVLRGGYYVTLCCRDGDVSVEEITPQQL